MLNSQRGITQVVLVLVLVAGLGAALVLSQQTQIFKPRAQEAGPNTVIPPYGPTPAPPYGLSYCSARIADFSVSDPCDYEENGFRQVRFSCSGKIEVVGDQAVQAEGDHQSCKSIEEWVRVAASKCDSFCLVPSPEVSPVPTGSPCKNDSECTDGQICKGLGAPGIVVGVCVPNVTPIPPYPSLPPRPIISPPSINPSPYLYVATPTPSPVPQPIWPPISYYCPEVNEWRYLWQSCP